MNYPKKVTIGDITVRDGFQHEEILIPTQAKLWTLEQLVLAGFKHIEVSNFGNPKGMPQFADADDLFKGIRNSKKVKEYYLKYKSKVAAGTDIIAWIAGLVDLFGDVGSAEKEYTSAAQKLAEGDRELLEFNRKVTLGEEVF